MEITKFKGVKNWYAVKRINYKLHRISTYLPTKLYTKTEARQLAKPLIKKYLQSLEEPSLAEKSRELKISTMFALYLRDNKLEWSSSTKKDYRRISKKFRDYFGGNTLLHTLWLSDRSGLKNLHTYKKMRYQENVEPSTINKDLDVIKGAYNHIKNGYSVYKLGNEPNWTSLVEIPPDQPDRSIEDDDFIKIFFALPPHAQNVVWFSLIALGVRKVNVTGLNYNQIKENKIEFWVKSKKKRRIGNQIVSGKIHTIPLMGGIYNLITGQKLSFETEENHQARVQCLNLTGQGNVFLYQGRPFKDPKKTWEKTQKRLGITRVGKDGKIKHKYRIHDLRHTAGSIIGVELGDDYSQRALGHSTMQMTRNYNKKDMEMKVVGMKKIEEVLENVFKNDAIVSNF
jgi:integrase